MPDLSPDEKKRLYDRCAELGLEAVKAISADGFPSVWRLDVLRWIASGGKAPPEPKEK